MQKLPGQVNLPIGKSCRAQLPVKLLHERRLLNIQIDTRQVRVLVIPIPIEVWRELLEPGIGCLVINGLGIATSDVVQSGLGQRCLELHYLIGSLAGSFLAVAGKLEHRSEERRVGKEG